ncbi:uncharacterized protein LOC123549560 [Mercenaria mercenaria]|uniref:uncharacterized protein LOC123549560 n=1 Tax=Mercenaria mercenaria TaxID=6596 RepID=UPI00234F9CAD|nr:uncharacterized protein LOC123549560 [Mercenaria mercenaria]XP_053401206.1 uncharacterized protein LOC123549560 [Mercenaria mercenaria]XP_053401207.1 uncharacterized protein LOC123549560 [Mercenaria mercenaria]
MSEAIETLEETPELLSADWQQRKSIGACMLEMYDRCLWTDVMFHCKDSEEGEVIKAHKIVLAARSPVFQAMFFGPCADGKDEVKLNDVEKDSFLSVLRYIYSDTVTLTEENVTAVINLAHCYQVSSLVQYCADYLATSITPDNACEILTTAMLFQISSLKGTCCSFIDDHAQQVLKSEGFLNLSEECLLLILRGDTFYAEEQEILETAEKWSKRRLLESGMAENSTNVRKFLGKLFYQLRLPTMTNKALLEYVSRKGYFSIEEYADISGWINKVPNIKVSTNSCVARVPKLESIQVNIENSDEVIRDSISCSFEISVSKDVALANITLSEVTPQLMYEKMYTDERRYSSFVGQISEEDKLSAILRYGKYEDRIIKLQTLDNKKSNSYSAFILYPLQEVLPRKLGLVLSGTISIKCLKFNQSFKVQQQQYENATVTLTTPLVLKKGSDPYCVSVNYSVCVGLKMTTRYHKSTEPISNSDGTIKIRSRCYSGESFLGIKKLGFLNFSNRYKDSDPETSEKKS